MRFKSAPVTIVALTSLIVLIGCNNITYNGVKFNKSQWSSIDDLHSHPKRENMLEDLIEHHKIKGLTYHQIIDSLGQPENYGDTKDSIYYNIVVNYGYLDPKSGKYLAIGFNKDSIATGFKVVEWKNGHANE
ncbi:MAG: hypothetical protein JWP37_3025 [Mucilaginibacter sp.]|nr:hypothetical protein [Mucilaginibacter sp.]